MPDLPQKKAGNTTRTDLLVALARRENLSIRDLYKRVAGARGHYQIIGTPKTLCDMMQQWVEEGAADGFNIMPPSFPTGLTDFVTLVIPELRRRGLFRSEYTGATLRHHLGLPMPRRRFQR